MTKKNANVGLVEKEYTCASKLGTSHISRHIPRCHKIHRFHDIEIY